MPRDCCLWGRVARGACGACGVGVGLGRNGILGSSGRRRRILREGYGGEAQMQTERAEEVESQADEEGSHFFGLGHRSSRHCCVATFVILSSRPLVESKPTMRARCPERRQDSRKLRVLSCEDKDR